MAPQSQPPGSTPQQAATRRVGGTSTPLSPPPPGLSAEANAGDADEGGSGCGFAPWSTWLSRPVVVPAYMLMLATGLLMVLAAVTLAALRGTLVVHHPTPHLPPVTVSGSRDISLDQIILFGDSITEESFDIGIDGFGAILSNAYARRLDVVNRGYSGFTTEWCKHFLTAVLNTTVPAPLDPAIHNPAHVALVVIFLGANDASLASHFPHQSISLELYAANLAGMVRDARRAAPRANVLLVTTPPVDPERSPGRSIERARAFRDAAIRVAAAALDIGGTDAAAAAVSKHGPHVAASHFPSPPWLRVLDTWTVILGSPDAEWDKVKVGHALRDGLHFSRSGNRGLAAAILAEIRGAWPALAPERISYRIPPGHYLDIDGLPDSAFVNARK
ncbi:hypothetical protein HK405_007249 [Cladochytrium tenue]|nr:hypothetical protein HK405_007249 [Cladochytrium tenue]